MTFDEQINGLAKLAEGLRRMQAGESAAAVKRSWDDRCWERLSDATLRFYGLDRNKWESEGHDRNPCQVLKL